MFTLLKDPGSCDLQNKHLIFSGVFFPMQTVTAHIRQSVTATLLGAILNHATRIAAMQNESTCNTLLFFGFRGVIVFS